jgi:hypothetical protein
MMAEFHECEVFKTGTMVDITSSNDGEEIYCRRCGGKLQRNQVDKSMLKWVDEKIKKAKNRR